MYKLANKAILSSSPLYHVILPCSRSNFNFSMVTSILRTSTCTSHHYGHLLSFKNATTYSTLRLLSLHANQKTAVLNETRGTKLNGQDTFGDSEQATIIELDELRFKQISKEFVDLLGKNKGKDVKNVWRNVPSLTLTGALEDYSKLAKIKLTGLVVLTTLAGFYMAAPSLNYTLLASTLAGTALTSGSAAAWNHFLEVPFDSQMKRTVGRPLVKGSISPLHAACFAMATGFTGLTILATCVNPLTAALGGLNLCLYSFIYTPMKRIHIGNTWVGAVVGAIPPVMGFTAINGFIDLPAIFLGLVLYSWQFPHFNALSWNMRHEYARAGYRMMSVTNPKLCQNTALRHSVMLVGFTGAMCLTDLTHWSFGIDSLPFSLYLIYLSYRFRQDPTSQTSRKLFLYSLIYLPVIMFLMVISKNRQSKPAQTNQTSSTNVQT